MPTLPDASTLGTRLPQSSRPIASYRSGQVGEALSDAGVQLQRTGEEQQQKQDQLELAYARSHLLRGQIEAESELENDQDYTTYEKRYGEKIGALRAQAAGMISNGRVRKVFELDADTDITRGLASIKTKARQKESDYANASALETIQRNNQAAFQTSDPARRSQLLAENHRVIDGLVAKGYMKREEAVLRRQKIAEDYGETWAKMQSPDTLLKLLTPSQPKPGDKTIGGFDTAIQTVLANEGGMTPIDGSSGAPAIYGINQKWHPEAYAEAKRLTDTKGEAEGRQYAQQFYKKEFWDRHNIDQLPPATQTIVLDGVVNHTSAFGKQLVEEARKGATPEQLIAMRRAEYQRLATANPGKYAASLPGWTNRLDNLPASGLASESAFPTTGTPLDFIAPDKKLALLDHAKTSLKRDIELRQKDPIAYALENNLTKYTEPLSFGATTDFGLEMRRRRDIAVTMRYAHGTPIKAFTETEANQLADRIARAQPEEQLALVNGIYEGFGPYTLEALGQIAEKDKVFSHYAGLVASNPERGQQIALEAFKGRAILQGNPDAAPSGKGKVLGMPLGKDMETTFRQTVGNSLQYLPGAEAALLDAAKALYVKRAYDANNLEQFDSGLFEQAVQDAMGAAKDQGAIFRLNDRDTIAPAGITPQQFEDFLERMKPDDALNLSLTGGAPVDARGRPIRPEDLYEHGEFITVGNGRYKIKMPDGFVMTPGGTEYILSATPERVRQVLDR